RQRSASCWTRAVQRSRKVLAGGRARRERAEKRVRTVVPDGRGRKSARGQSNSGDRAENVVSVSRHGGAIHTEGVAAKHGGTKPGAARLAFETLLTGEIDLSHWRVCACLWRRCKPESKWYGGRSIVLVLSACSPEARGRSWRGWMRRKTKVTAHVYSRHGDWHVRQHRRSCGMLQRRRRCSGTSLEGCIT